jgi:predicted RNA-binding Zn-ribbon protein involved in translation (DUF1610 family)
MVARKANKENGFLSVCPECLEGRYILKRHLVGGRCGSCSAKARYPENRKEHKCPDCGQIQMIWPCRKRERCRPCAARHSSRTHGQSAHPLFGVWAAAKDRCYRQLSKDYKRYGARGITVCDEWMHDFEAFFKWAIANGWKKGLELDREDNEGNYSPVNCRFVTHRVNCNNKTSSKR